MADDRSGSGDDPDNRDDDAIGPEERAGSNRRERASRRSASGAPSVGAAVHDVFSADETFQRLTATSLHEFNRTPRQLWFSGLGAGLALGTVLMARIAVAAGVGDYEVLAANLLYPIGFLIVVIGRYQLFTENTLTPLTLVLTRLASIPSLLRLWGIVLVANLVGAAAIGIFLAVEGVLEERIVEMGVEVATHAFEMPILHLFLRGIIAGALVAAMVWMTHAVRESTARVLIIYGIFLVIPTAGLFHVITGFVEVVFGVAEGVGSWGQAFAFVLAVGLGNTVGGVVLVTLLNFGQTKERQLETLSHIETLSWRDWLTGLGGDPVSSVQIAPELAGTQEEAEAAQAADESADEEAEGDADADRDEPERDEAHVG